MDAGPPPERPSLSTVRAGIVLIAFAVGVVLLVAVGTRAATTPAPTSATRPAVAPIATTTTTAHAGTPAKHKATAASGTTTTVPHSSVSVVVANGTTTSGLAAHFASVIGGGGWNMEAPTNATSTSVSTSAVYYAPGQQAAAMTIASGIGVKPAQVQPISSSIPLSSTSGIDVIVVIGQDLASSSSG